MKPFEDMMKTQVFSPTFLIFFQAFFLILPFYACSEPTTYGIADPKPKNCDPLKAPTGQIITITPEMAPQLQERIHQAKAGDTFLFEKGIYPLNGQYLWISKPNVTLRSKSGNPKDVVLDGNYQTTEIITIAASNVTLAEISLQKAYTHPIHVVSSENSHTLNTFIYRVHITDPREQAIKINPNNKDYFADQGEIACSTIRLTDEGRPKVNPISGGCYTGGIDAHQARDWVIRDNVIRGFWCKNGLAEHAIHLWTGSRGTLVERNTLINNARGIGFGLRSSGDPRTYPDRSCTVNAYIGHHEGLIKNNMILAENEELFNSNGGFDCGICLASSCNTEVYHNTIVSLEAPFSSIEWRFKGSQGVKVYNNLATHPFRPREHASADLKNNLETASLSFFKDISNENLHLTEVAKEAINQGVDLSTRCPFDIDGEKRSRTPDLGADESTYK